MLINKKKLGFLIAIPLYALYCYLSVLFFGKEFHLGDILCLSVFVVSATAIMVCKRKILKILCLLLSHLGLIGVCFLFSDYFELTINEMFVYCLFCFPPLVLIYSAEYLQNKSLENKKDDAEASIKDSNALYLFEVLCFSPFITLLICFVTGKEVVSFKFDSTAIFLLLVLVFQTMLLIANHFKKEFFQSELKKLFFLCVIVSACNCLMYSFFAYRFVQDKVYLAFSMITVLVIIFEERSKEKAALGK